MLDAVIGPLTFRRAMWTRSARGNPPASRTTYNGDFNLIKNNLNTLIDAMDEIRREPNRLLGRSDR